jgi:CheY-like chemotaxis protein
VEGAILLGHTHWDHIQGFPFFAPAFHPGSRITIYAPTGGDVRLSEVLAGQMQYTYFPVDLGQLQASIEFRELGEGEFSIGDASIRTQYLNHTALTLGYRVTAGGVTVVYATDHEPHAQRLLTAETSDGGTGLSHPADRRHVEFLAGADLVIHDAQYTMDEYAQKIGWGHSPVEYVVDVAAAAGVESLGLFHHDPSRGDRDLDRLVAAAQRRAEASSAELAVFGAREGQVISLREAAAAAADRSEPDRPVLEGRPRLLIVEDDAAIRELLTATFAEDDYELVVARDGREAVGLALGRPPDLVLLDLMMPNLDGLGVCRALRSEPETHETPIVMLTVSDSDADMQGSFEEGATDYLTKPFAPALVRTRVRSWLLRGGNG